MASIFVYPTMTSKDHKGEKLRTLATRATSGPLHHKNDLYYAYRTIARGLWAQISRRTSRERRLVRVWEKPYTMYIESNKMFLTWIDSIQSSLKELMR